MKNEFIAFIDGAALTKTFFSPKFGMLADKFGVHWMIMTAQ